MSEYYQPHLPDLEPALTERHYSVSYEMISLTQEISELNLAYKGLWYEKIRIDNQMRVEGENERD